MIAQLLYDGYLQFDFSYTAYATNAYLKAAQRASLILQGKRTQPCLSCSSRVPNPYIVLSYVAQGQLPFFLLQVSDKTRQDPTAAPIL